MTTDNDQPPTEDQPTPIASAADPCEGIEEHFHPVVKEYGRDMFAAVYNSNMVQQALAQLMENARKHQSRKSGFAVQVVASCFNATMGSLLVKEGWTTERIEKCNQAMLLAAQTKVQVVSGSGLIIPTRH